ncbi:hypothetical protein FA13DRAFT_1795034 [Coprinellus micaceus]|uniref:Uncharacterized protein n=1 Tax=Coprinellus micaceus TaxID=71717 RepID=A0A4Y7SZZ6_COPMI|nr:hypothetical protein FA13DRAFT_1795034 [Coprinellus micaceus]
MALPDRPGLGDTDTSTLACMSAAVVYQLFTGSVRGKQIALEYLRHVQHLLPELFQAARVSAIAYKSKMISPDLIADTEAYASTITRLSAEPYIDYGSRKIKLLREHFPFDCEAYESVPLMSVDPSGAIATVTWAGPSPTLLIAMYVPMPLVDASALQAVYSSATPRDMPSSKWANLYLYTCTQIGCAVRVYGAKGEAMSANTKEIYLRRLGNELGWAAIIGAIADTYNHRVWHQKLVTNVLTALTSDDPSDPEAYSTMKPYKVLDVLFEVNTLSWWGDTANITVRGFCSLDAVVNAFTQDRVTTIDWGDALAFTERLSAAAVRGSSPRHHID